MPTRKSRGRRPKQPSSGKVEMEGMGLKQQGNAYFYNGCYLEAMGYYYQAAIMIQAAFLRKQGSDKSETYRLELSKAWSSVTECHLRLGNWQAAEDAATQALQVEPSNTKALYRRAKARFELSDYVGAAQDADAVGTQDSKEVAATCRQLEANSLLGKINTGDHGDDADEDEARDDVGVHAEDEEDEEVRAITSSSQEEPQQEKEVARKLWFRRIVDSYRLRVDDEYTQTGLTDPSSLYGIRSKGSTDAPMGHFKDYVHRALKKRFLPQWFTEDAALLDELYHFATTDDLSNINYAIESDELLAYHGKRGMPYELETLRDLALFIEGPIGEPCRPTERKTRNPPSGIDVIDKELPQVISKVYRLSAKIRGKMPSGTETGKYTQTASPYGIRFDISSPVNDHDGAPLCKNVHQRPGRKSSKSQSLHPFNPSSDHPKLYQNDQHRKEKKKALYPTEKTYYQHRRLRQLRHRHETNPTDIQEARVRQKGCQLFDLAAYDDDEEDELTEESWTSSREVGSTTSSTSVVGDFSDLTAEYESP